MTTHSADFNELDQPFLNPVELQDEPALQLTEAVATSQAEDIEQGSATAATERPGRLARFAKNWKTNAQLFMLGVEISPANELLRGAAVTTGALYSHSPLMSAATFGGSTLLVEGAAALTAANLFDKPVARKRLMQLRGKRINLGYNDDKKVSAATQTLANVMGGTAVGMAFREMDGATYSKKERLSYGAKSTLGLGALCTGVGYFGNEAVDFMLHSPYVDGAGAGTAVLAYGGLKLRHAIRSRKAVTAEIAAGEIPTTWVDKDSYAFTYGKTEDPATLEAAAKLEQSVWDKKGYGDLSEEGYDNLIEHSHTFVAYDQDKIIGMNRMFGNEAEQLPPFLTEMPYYDETKRQELADMVAAGTLEELGTVVVDEASEDMRVNMHMWRAAYRDAVERGVTHWGIIMEPERVAKMNKYHGFTFEQLGEAKQYQGGECAAHYLKVQDSIDNMYKQYKYLSWYWMAKAKLRPPKNHNK